MQKTIVLAGPDSRYNPKESFTDGIKSLIKSAASKLKGSARRLFMAETVRDIHSGGKSFAERELGWNRGTIRKGMHELESGIHCLDGFSLRGRRHSNKRLPNLNNDIHDIVDPEAHVDATLKTQNLYIKMTADQVREQLIKQKNYREEDLPKRRTISTIINQVGYRLRKVKKNKPLKKIPQTDAIFETLHSFNREADRSEDTLRISMDSKATVKLGPFSRGGRSRVDVNAADHDFGGGSVTPHSILLPQYDELYISFSESKITSDYMWDRIVECWPEWLEKYRPKTLLINQDNGPENNSRRTQFIRRAVEFVNQYGVTIQLAYYPPYHSKYNPVERTHGALEQYWNGKLLTDVQTTINIAQNMKWKGKHPTVTLVSKVYEIGVKLTKKAMAAYEKVIKRMSDLEDWFVEIKPAPL